MKNREVESWVADIAASRAAPGIDLSNSSTPHRPVAGGRSDFTPLHEADRSPAPISGVRRLIEPDFARVGEALRKKTIVDDRVFDEVYPLSIRRVSSVYWTPVEVAMRATELLVARKEAVILDVGAGVGKFCIIAAASAQATVEGVEHRAQLVDIGRHAAEKIGVRVQLTHGTLADVDARRVDGVYLFNPFLENLCSPSDYLDDSVELGEARFHRDVAEAERFLGAARPGTRLVTYCGWGGVPPDDYRLHLRENRAGTLELWIKTPGYSRVRDGSEPVSLLGGAAPRERRE